MPFPQHPRKHTGRPLFTAVDFSRYWAKRTGLAPPRPPRSVVLLFGRHRWHSYLSRRYRGARDPRTDVYRVRDGVGVTLVDGPGAPLAAIVVEELAALGVRRFVIVGIAGSLQPELRAGCLVLCNGALRDEGTSHHYVRSGLFARPSSRLTRAVKAALRREEVPFEEGSSWSIDAVYRETASEVRRYRKAGISTVEMEASAVFCVARYCGCEAAALFVISDHLSERKWEPRFHDTKPGLRRALQIAIESLAD